MNRVVLSELRGPWLTLQLNRPEQLNAVDINVARCGIKSLVDNVRNAQMLLASGSGRAVAAGGDVHGMVKSISSGRPADSELYLRSEYQFYHMMNTLPIPSVTLMPQICMGGGLGFCHSTTIRVASERTRMAMPESKIGIFADVGAGYFLNQLQVNGAAKWLGLTSRHIFGAETVQLGLATHLVPFERHAELGELLLLSGTFTEVKEIVDSMAIDVPEMEPELVNTIGFYDAAELGDIIERLKTAGLSDELALFDQVCPMGAAVTNANLNRAKGKSLADVFKQEFRAMRYQQRDCNFIEGVRALLVDRDNQPKWTPNTINELLTMAGLEAELNKRFEPTTVQDGLLGDSGTSTPELEILTWDEINNDEKLIYHLFPNNDSLIH